MEELVKQAESLGIAIDKRWGAARLHMEIDNASRGAASVVLEPEVAPVVAAPLSPPAPKAIEIKLEIVRDYWPVEGRRIREGQPFECDVSTALGLIEAGIAKRAS